MHNTHIANIRSLSSSKAGRALRGSLRKISAADREEIESYSRKYSGEVRNAVPFLAKEQYSYPPILAPDFDVLHRYFFPSAQADEDIRLVLDARSLIDSFPHKIVILPGTAIELTRHIGQVYRIADKVSELLSKEALSHDKKLQLTETAAELATLLKAETPRLASTDMLSWISSQFRHISDGISRVDSFLKDRRTVRIEEFDSAFNTTNEEFETIAGELQTIYSALSSPTERHKTANIWNDATNMAAALLLHDRFGQPESQNQSAVMFVTTTKRILAANYDRFSSDPLLQKLIASGSISASFLDIFGEEPFYFRPTPMSTALRYCEMRSSNASIGKAVSVAKLTANTSRILSLLIERIGIDEESQRGDDSDASDYSHAKHVLSYCFKTLARANDEIDDFHAGARTKRAMESPRAKGNKTSGIAETYPRGGSDEYLDTKELESIKTFVDNLRRRGLMVAKMVETKEHDLAVHELRDEVVDSPIIRCERWIAQQLCSAYWPASLDIDSIASLINKTKAQEQEHCLYVRYESNVSDMHFFDSEGLKTLDSNDQQIRRFVAVDSLRGRQLVGLYKGEKCDRFCIPDIVTFACESHQVAYRLPHARTGDYDVAFQCWSEVGQRAGGRYLLHTHSQRNNCELMRQAYGVIRDQIRELLT